METASNVPLSVVLVHGLWGNPGDWQWVARLLEDKGVSVLCPDLPSHRLEGTGLLDDVEAVKTAIVGCQGPTVVAGWSYGCDVVGIAAHGMGNVARLVYVSSVPQPVQHAQRHATTYDGNPVILWKDQDRFVLNDHWWVYEEKGRTFPAEVRRHIEANPRRTVTRRTLSDPIPAAAWVNTPVTVLLGTRDELISAERRAWAKENISDVRDVDDDHFILFNSPGLLADVIMEEETINRMRKP